MVGHLAGIFERSLSWFGSASFVLLHQIYLLLLFFLIIHHRYFSRNSNDYSESFGLTKYRGTFTPHVANLFKDDIKTCILDGEMVGYDPNIDDFVLKGANIDIKSEHLGDGDGGGVHPCFVVFDVLMVNGENFANVPLQERIQKSETLFDTEKGRMEIVERRLGKTKYTQQIFFSF